MVEKDDREGEIRSKDGSLCKATNSIDCSLQRKIETKQKSGFDSLILLV